MPRKPVELRAETLSRHIQENVYTFGAEVGVQQGGLSRRLLQMNPILTLIGVDYWPVGYLVRPDLTADHWDASAQARYRDRFFTILGKFPRLSLIEKPSVEAANDIKDGSLDFVFIDADHSYEGCLADIAAWSPKVRKGGMISGHDYHQEDYPSVCRAVEDAFGTGGYIVEDEFIWIAKN